jgi:dihydropteroate synthase
MKKFIILSFFLSALVLTSAHAANNSQGDWKQRIMSEKIAFLTMEMGITPEEALSATQAVHAVALMNGADILRVHDVSTALQTVTLLKYL